MPSPIQTADAIARLEQYRRMVTPDGVVEILTFKTRSAVVRHLLPHEEPLSNEENDSP